MNASAIPQRALVAACIGNLVEWYDFAIFATAFLFRPVGAMRFGRRGDRLGRRRVLAFVIILMSLATTGIAVLPGHASIGLVAPVLLILLRAAQGISVGGEASGASAFVVEYAPAGRRGWYGAGSGPRSRLALG